MKSGYAHCAYVYAVKTTRFGVYIPATGPQAQARQSLRFLGQPRVLRDPRLQVSVVKLCCQEW